MKLRIKGNSLRLRLSQTEVGVLKEKGIVKESICFGDSENHCLTYVLSIVPGTELFAELKDQHIRVLLPERLAKKWFEPEEISIRGSQALKNSELKILVEKDFQCLKPRPEEDESNLYPHPDLATKTC